MKNYLSKLLILLTVVTLISCDKEELFNFPQELQGEINLGLEDLDMYNLNVETAYADDGTGEIIGYSEGCPSYGMYEYTLFAGKTNDADESYNMESGESTFEGITVNLLDSNGNVIATTLTAADGSYIFEGLEGGLDYTVVVADEMAQLMLLFIWRLLTINANKPEHPIICYPYEDSKSKRSPRSPFFFFRLARIKKDQKTLLSFWSYNSINSFVGISLSKEVRQEPSPKGFLPGQHRLR